MYMLLFLDGESKIDKFQSLLDASVLNLEELRQLSWSGVPAKLRSVTWRLLSVSKTGNLYRIFIFLVYSLKTSTIKLSFVIHRNIFQQI